MKLFDPSPTQPVKVPYTNDNTESHLGSLTKKYDLGNTVSFFHLKHFDEGHHVVFEAGFDVHTIRQACLRKIATLMDDAVAAGGQATLYCGRHLDAELLNVAVRIDRKKVEHFCASKK